MSNVARLSQVSDEYTQLKLERNKCVSLLQTAMKVSLDTRERLKLHTNEAEIFVTWVHRQEQAIMRERRLHTTVLVMRDHRRHEVCKLAAVHQEQHWKREQMRQAIQRLNAMYNQTEAEIISMKKACDRNARLRNERAMLLIERNQEVYILQERAKAQEMSERQALIDLRGLDAQYQCFKLYSKQVERYTNLFKDQVPKKHQLESRVKALIHEVRENWHQVYLFDFLGFGMLIFFCTEYPS
ncbi:unnamed protein product [Protopolystoma xenopodis]|uniref:Uncharacterized protein n=1 Tax=Protopolystoma xenopodis TaxID=117903 RepID=A0A448WEV4_9PLAT|nr:unnamed protein product [Protopolystoma xenopodis]